MNRSISKNPVEIALTFKEDSISLKPLTFAAGALAPIPKVSSFVHHITKVKFE